MTIVHESFVPRLIEAGGLQVVFQPIFWLRDGRLYGYEALGRVDRGILRTVGDGQFERGLGPAELLDLAARIGQLLAIDLTWRAQAIVQVARQDPKGSGLIFLNVDPRGLKDPDFRPGKTTELIRAHGLPTERFVLELTEAGTLLESSALERELASAAAAGIGLAVDDLGSGFASLDAVVRLRPGHVKLDRALVSGAARDPLRAHLIAAVSQFCRASEMALIAEGIEREEDLLALTRAGVPLGQGHLLARPRAGLDPSPLTARRRRSLRRVARAFWFE